MTIGDFLNVNANGLAWCWLVTVLAYCFKRPARPETNVTVNYQAHEDDEP